MSCFNLTILGSSSALPTSKRFPTAHVLNVHERFFLFDCGEGTQIQLRKHKIKFNKLSHLFISHTHGDHVFGFFGLMSTLNLLGRKNTLKVFAPAGFKDTIDFFLKKYASDLQFTIDFTPVSTTQHHVLWENKNLYVKSIPLQHRVPTCGYLVKEKPRLLNMRKEAIEKYKLGIKQINNAVNGADIEIDGKLIKNELLTLPPILPRSYAFCTDTLYKPDIARYIQQVDLLYHEATFLETNAELAKKTMHSTAKQAAQIASLAKARKLIIGHFSARYPNEQVFLHEAQHVFTNTVLANEGETHEVKQVRADSHFNFIA